VLERRIENARKNVEIFNVGENAGQKAAPKIMFQSSYACMACHQQAKVKANEKSN
jgi:cytochrome c551/c552